MPKLVDTTIRLLSQEPLAGKVPTGEVLRIAEILDKAGFACLEVSGGGVFDAAVRRAVESPWERIRALDARTTTPLGIALRGRFLVGSKPVSADVVRRFIASASENGIDVFRIHDPLNDVIEPSRGGGGDRRRRQGVPCRVSSSARASRSDRHLVEQAKPIPELGPRVVVINDPTDALKPHLTEELVSGSLRRPGFPVGLYVQGAAGTGLSNAVVATRVGAELVATAVYPLALTLHRVSGRVARRDAARARARHRRRHRPPLGGRRPDRRAHRRRAGRSAGAAHRRARRRVRPSCRPRRRSRRALCARARPSDRLLDTLDELGAIREEAGWPPLRARRSGEILAQQAMSNVFSRSRYGYVSDEFRQLVKGGFGVTPGPIDRGRGPHGRVLGSRSVAGGRARRRSRTSPTGRTSSLRRRRISS